jgi:type IV secretory pathway VirD2 relaxase
VARVVNEPLRETQKAYLALLPELQKSRYQFRSAIGVLTRHNAVQVQDIDAVCLQSSQAVFNQPDKVFPSETVCSQGRRARGHDPEFGRQDNLVTAAVDGFAD